jgi:hypothetical protein
MKTRLQTEIYRRDTSVAEIAKKIGRSRQYVWAVVAGKYNFGVDREMARKFNTILFGGQRRFAEFWEEVNMDGMYFARDDDVAWTDAWHGHDE